MGAGGGGAGAAEGGGVGGGDDDGVPLGEAVEGRHVGVALAQVGWRAVGGCVNADNKLVERSARGNSERKKMGAGKCKSEKGVGCTVVHRWGR